MTLLLIAMALYAGGELLNALILTGMFSRLPEPEITAEPWARSILDEHPVMKANDLSWIIHDDEFYVATSPLRLPPNGKAVH